MAPRLVARLSLTLVACLALSGCGIWSQIIPGVPFDSVYVVNRGGSYFVGTRCDVSLSDVGVFLSNPYSRTNPTIDWSQALWHATAAPPATGEVQLFGANQSGVTVEHDGGARPTSQLLYVYMTGPTGGWGRAVYLDRIGVGQVDNQAGIMSWKDFMNIPDSHFGWC